MTRKGNRQSTVSAANCKELFMKSTALSLDQKVPAVLVRIQSNACDPWSSSRSS